MSPAGSRWAKQPLPQQEHMPHQTPVHMDAALPEPSARAGPCSQPRAELRGDSKRECPPPCLSSTLRDEGRQGGLVAHPTLLLPSHPRLLLAF